MRDYCRDNHICMVCMRVPVAGYACCLSCRTRNSDRHAQKLWDARVERENSYREGVHLGDRNKRYPLVDVEEAAQMLGVPVRRIYRLVQMGELTVVLRAVSYTHLTLPTKRIV